MARPRTFVLAIGAGVLLGAYLIAWLHLLPYLGVIAGALAAVAVLVLAAALGDDPQVSTRAFREAAPDLAGRLPGHADPREPPRWAQPEGLAAGLPYDRRDGDGGGGGSDAAPSPGRAAGGDHDA